jgi:S1-C subfamily serine protease
MSRSQKDGFRRLKALPTTPARGVPLLAVTLAFAGLAGCGQSNDAATSPPTAAPVAASTGGAALSVQRQVEEVVKAVSPSVVQVQTDGGLGSGVVFDGRGDIVTNAHVVDGSTQFAVTLANGDQHSATLVGVDRGNDIAVIRLSSAAPKPASFADSSTVEAGETALALGNPLGLRASVTEGIVSGERQSVPEGNGVTLPSVIQTSAEINPGNSGGALVDVTGRVIGIPTLAALDPDLGDAQAPGIGFAIPSNTARSIATHLIDASSTK